MRRSIILAAAAAATLSATPSMAAIVIGSVTPATPVYSGPTPTFNFDGATPGLSGGGVLFASNVNGAQPIGSTGGFLVSGPTYGAATLTSSAFAYATSISLLWGSIDNYNTLQFLDGSGNLLASFSGSQILSLTGSGVGGAQPDALVTFNLSGTDSASVRSLRFLSSSNSFEVDNISVAVPEPATWGMMIVGFAAVGMGMRRRKAVRTSVSFG